MPLSELNDLDRGYIVNDTCIIEVEVAVSGVMDSSKNDSKMEAGDVGVTNQGTPISETDSVAESMPELEMPTELDGQRNETEYLHAGQLFEEGRHCQSFLDAKNEDIGGFSVLKTQAALYKQIWLKYGHIASSQVLTATYVGQVTMVTVIVTCVMDMHHGCFTEVSSEMIDSWEKKITMAEKLKFNIRWLRERVEDVKKDFYGEQKLKTELMEQVQSLRAAKAEVIKANDGLKKAQENLSVLETRISPVLTKRQMYLEKGSRLLFDGLL